MLTSLPVADIFIVLLAVGAALRGFQIGFTRQLISTIGFVAGLLPGSFLAGLAMSHADSASRPIIGLAVILTVSFIAMTLSELLAIKLKYAVSSPLLHRIDNLLGSFIAIITLLFGAWLANALIQLTPPNGLQTVLKKSAIITLANRMLPPAPTVMSALNSLVQPNQQPQVFDGREPSPSAQYQLPDSARYSDMLQKVSKSVVKIEGLGCGGLVDGSGFVIDNNHIVTNAHVIAGVTSPRVSDTAGSHDTKVVWFDAQNDIAVLEVSGLAGPPLSLDRALRDSATQGFVLGYPGGGDLSTEPMAIIDSFKAKGRDIYGRTATNRTIYALQSTIVAGNSGGPVIDTTGSVIGIVFATSTTYNNVGYALTIEQVSTELTRAVGSHTTYSTGQCSE